MEFMFKVKLWNQDGTYTLDTKSEAQIVADWFRDLNSWKVGDEYESISFEPVGKHIKCTFKAYEDTSDLMIEGLLDPDDDGNHPIKFGNEEYLCMGERV